MLEAVTQILTQAVENNVWLAPLGAFAGGLMTAANPCVLAMVPLMIGYVAGQNIKTPGRSLLLSLVFCFGLTMMFLGMFLTTWVAGSALRSEWWRYAASAVCLLMGLHLLGVFNWQLPAPNLVQPKHRGLVGAFILGLLFGVVSLPCAGPVLLAVLSLVPVKGAGFGAVLLVAYSLGHCGLILVGGTSMGFVQRLADSRGWQRGMTLVRRLAGALIIVIGLVLAL